MLLLLCNPLHNASVHFLYATADACRRVWHMTDSQLLVFFNASFRRRLPWQLSQLRNYVHYLGAVNKRTRAGVTAQRAKAMENYWTHWDTLCLEHNVDHYIRAWEEPIHCSKYLLNDIRTDMWLPARKTCDLAVTHAHSRGGAQGRPWWNRFPYPAPDPSIQEVGLAAVTSQTYPHFDHHLYCQASIPHGWHQR
jgi:hypothetical protein